MGRVNVTEEMVAQARAAPMHEVLSAAGIDLPLGPSIPQQFRCSLHGDGQDLSGRGSARYYPETNGAKCWGCGKWRDPIQWLVDFYGYAFNEAVAQLCREYGGDVAPEYGQSAAKRRSVEGADVLAHLEVRARRLAPRMSLRQRVGLSQVLDRLWAHGCPPGEQSAVEDFLSRVEVSSPLLVLA